MADTSEMIVEMLLEMRAEMVTSFQDILEQLTALDQRLVALVTEQQGITHEIVEKHLRLRAMYER